MLQYIFSCGDTVVLVLDHGATRHSNKHVMLE